MTAGIYKPNQLMPDDGNLATSVNGGATWDRVLFPPQASELAGNNGGADPGFFQDPNQALYVHCKSGMRSLKAVQFLKEQGFKYAKSVKGGILAWADEIDHNVAKY